MSTNSYGWVKSVAYPPDRILFILQQKGAEEEGTQMGRSSQAELFVLSRHRVHSGHLRPSHSSPL